MPGLRQLVRHPRIPQSPRSKSPALKSCPQKKGLCLKIYLRKPKKPNSALRKLCRVRLSTGRRISAYIPGEGHNLQEFNSVLIRGGRAKDLPGVRYHVIRGKYDCLGLIKRTTSRSKYGARKP